MQQLCNEIPQIQIKLNSSFDELIVSTVDEVFANFGEKTQQMLYTILASDYKIEKQDIPKKISEFANALEHMIGISALLIEINIVKVIHEKIPEFEWNINSRNFKFARYIESLKSYMENNVSL